MRCATTCLSSSLLSERLIIPQQLLDVVIGDFRSGAGDYRVFIRVLPRDLIAVIRHRVGEEVTQFFSHIWQLLLMGAGYVGDQSVTPALLLLRQHLHEVVFVLAHVLIGRHEELGDAVCDIDLSLRSYVAAARAGTSQHQSRLDLALTHLTVSLVFPQQRLFDQFTQVVDTAI